MQITHFGRVVAASVFFAAFVGCASKPPVPVPAAGTEAPANDGTKPIAGGSDATDGGSANAGGGGGNQAAAGGDGSAGGAGGAIKSDDADDACGFAAAGFEKRARPAIKACYREGRKKDANLVGGVRIVVNVADNGKVGNVVTSPNGDKPLLPKPVIACMTDAIKKTDPGDTAKCKSKTLVIPIQFPTQ